MVIAPAQPVAPPTSPAARRYSIFDAAVGPLDLPDNRLADVTYTVPWCGPGGQVIEADCEPPEREPEDGLSIVDAVAFEVRRAFVCKAPSFTTGEAAALARQRLEASEHRLVEEAVAGMLAASGAVALGTGATIADVVGLAEEYAYVTAGYGLRAVLHVPVRAAAHMAASTQVDTVSGALRTELGTTVYYNAGLPNDTAYITGQLVLWRGAMPWVTPDAVMLNRVTNDYEVEASRDYAAGWECFTGSVELGVFAG